MKGKKNFNAKAFLANHAEKLGFGLIALIVVGIWAAEFFGGSWSRERRSPAALIQDIEKKKAEIDSTSWPAEKQASFQPVDFSERALTLLRPISSTKYELSTDLFVPLNRPKEKAREPDFLPVESLSAVPGHVILALMSEDEIKANEDGYDDSDPMSMSDSDAEEAEGDENTRRDGNRGTAGGSRGLIGFGSRDEDDRASVPDRPGRSGGPGGPGTSRFDKKISKIGPGALPTGGDALVGQDDAEKKGRNKKKRRGLSGQSPAGRFYVSVRGVWPLRRQMERIQRALHLPTTSSAMEHLELLDFELERQVASQGENPWSKAWEKIEVSRAMEILKEVDGFDDEPADMEVIDPVITMPLPMRAFGVWTDAGTHPRIKDYLLSPEGKEHEKVMLTRLLEQHELMKTERERVAGPKKGGFSSQVNDFRTMTSDMNRRNPMAMSKMMRDLSQDLRNTIPNGRMDLTAEQLAAKVTAVGRLLLFRYFDFDVRPGYAYRYRVKLVLRNPNFERAVTEVVDPSVAEGQQRETPVSNVSNPAVLPVSPRYFLHGIERNPLAEEGRRSRSVAYVNMFEWHKELGTQVSSVLELTALGQFVGGEKEIEILDVTVPEIDDQVYPFASEDLLLDVHADAELSPDQHPDLNLKAKKNNKPVELGLAPEAIVINSGGELRVVDEGKDTAEERALRSRLKSERKAFEGLTKKQEGSANPLDKLSFGNGVRFSDDDDNGLAGRGKKKNARGAGASQLGKGAAINKAARGPNPRRKAGGGRSAPVGMGGIPEGE